MIYYVVQLECRALHFSVDFIDETNQHERTHVHKINEQRINRQIELIHHIRDAKPFRLKHLPQRTRCYWWTKIIAFENGKLKEAYVMNLSNVLNPFTQNEWNISQMMQAIQITHTRNAYLFMFFFGELVTISIWTRLTCINDAASYYSNGGFSSIRSHRETCKPICSESDWKLASAPRTYIYYNFDSQIWHNFMAVSTRTWIHLRHPTPNCVPAIAMLENHDERSKKNQTDKNAAYKC